MNLSMTEILQLRSFRSFECLAKNDIIKKHIDNLQRSIWIHVDQNALSAFISTYNDSRTGDLANCKLIPSSWGSSIRFDTGDVSIWLAKERL